jgi:FKBP-type peptidyl-prolyl cis-trans isomerase 2
MSQVKIGDTVKVHYTGKLDGDMVFDTSTDRDPLEFEVGSGNIIKGFDAAVIGMKIGDQKTFVVTPEEGYGPHDEKLVADIARSQVPDQIDLKVGEALQVKHDSGRVIDVTISNVTDNHVTLDANHPLAGQTLTFDIELIAIA